MFYVKTPLSASTAIVTEITDENVFTRCPDCGAELRIDLNDVIDEDGQLDLYGMRVRYPTGHAVKPGTGAGTVRPKTFPKGN